MKRFINYFDKIFGNRFLALIGKEVAQILHNRQLLIQLLVPPTVFLILFGLALNPTFQNLKVGITDYSHSRYSRELIELFSQTDAFVISRYYSDQQDMQSELAKGNLTVGVTIPPEFGRDLARKRPAQLQAMFDAVDANTARVASGYLTQLVGDYNARRSTENSRQKGAGITTTNLSQQSNQSNSTTTNSTATNSTTSSSTNQQNIDSINTTNQQTSNPSDSTSTNSGNQSGSFSNSPDSSTNLNTSSTSGNSSNQTSSQRNQSTTTNSSPTNSVPVTNPPLPQNQVQLSTSVFYNPGLEASWFIVPGTIGILMTVLGSQAAASLVVREKEAGTIEQLMMTPASNTQVILAKICPLLLILTFDATIAILISRLVFGMPFRGNFILFISISILYFFVGISIGILIATFAKNEQQALLTTFFINPPLVLLSGGNSPIAAMPTFFQWLTYLDPMRYYIEVCRGVLLKGVGLGSLWHQVLILLIFAIVLTTLSIQQFRRQLS
ncbi:MAG: ABC transporter permease [Stenomitos rutilans HA7619-LM2]|jgi:ABC-type multidrug transport system permease subunit|nr:ABC transporter permease [Stenomitos rutilans HA7619-LM2]